MGCTIFTYGNTGVGCSDLYIQMRVTYGVANLLKGSSCCKHCKAADKRNFTGRSKSCCHSHHITFCDTTINMSVRVCFLKHACLGCCCKVSI